MRLGKIHVRNNVTANNMTGNTLASFFHEHMSLLDTIIVDDGFILYFVCPYFKDLDDNSKKIPFYHLQLRKRENVLGIQVEAILDENRQRVYDADKQLN